MRHSKCLVALAALACGAAACVDDTTCLSSDGSACTAEELAPEELAAQAPLSERLRALEADIGVGERGAGARAVNDFLTAAGYFPNDELNARYSSWRPVLDSGPEALDVFDAQTEQGILALQRRFDLEQTGVADEPTREHMLARRCGTPEGQREAEATIDKFSLHGLRQNAGETWLPRTVLAWSLGNVIGAVISPGCSVPASCTDAQLRSLARPAIRRAFDTWAAQTNMTFVEEDIFPDIFVSFASLGVGGDLGDGSFPQDAQHAIRLNAQGYTWQAGNTLDTSAGAPEDIQHVMLHEIGHALGLNHSSIPNAKMDPAPATNRTLTVDDTVAISTLYDVWEEAPGAGRATDIGVGSDGSDSNSAPDVWVLGDGFHDGGYAIYQWTGSSYQAATGNRVATAISVSGTTAVPWIVSNSRVYERSSTISSSGSWNIRGASDCARDVAASTAGRAWRIGCTAKNGGFNIAYYNGTTWVDEPGSAAAVRIAVEQGPNGMPWVVNSNDAVFRKKNGVWEQVPAGAKDIGAGPSVVPGKGYVFVTSPDSGNVYVWNEQDQVQITNDDGVLENDPFGPSSRRFRFFSGAGTRVAVGPDGRPWVVASGGTIWRTTK